MNRLFDLNAEEPGASEDQVIEMVLHRLNLEEMRYYYHSFNQQRYNPVGSVVCHGTATGSLGFARKRSGHFGLGRACPQAGRPQPASEGASAERPPPSARDPCVGGDASRRSECWMPSSYLRVPGMEATSRRQARASFSRADGIRRPSRGGQGQSGRRYVR